MEILASYDPEEVLPHVTNSNRIAKKSFQSKDGDFFKVKINSKRLRLFKNSCKCVCCGIEGVIFVLERHGKENPHINLYAIDDDDELILMTKDHILPVSKAGPDSLGNLQTMCSVCNGLKGGFPITNKDLQEVRAKYLSLRKGGMKHKKAFHIIEQLKIKMCGHNGQSQQKAGGN
jgi:5-methylcytosine-specific restriction endonuclease McrA